MRFLFVSAQLPGHLDWGGYLATAMTLQRMGHDLLWASGDAVRDQLAQAGIRQHTLIETGWRWPPPPPLQPVPKQDANADPAEAERAFRQRKQLRSLDQWLETERVVAAAHELLSVAENYRPHLIVGETFMASAAIVGELTDTPFVVAGWPAPLSRPQSSSDAMVELARVRLQDILTRCRASGRNWTAEGPPALCSPHMHVTYWSPTWFSGIEHGAQTRHFGGLANALPAAPRLLPPLLPEADDGPWVLVTLGTSFNNDPNFFIAAAHAVDRMGGIPLLALGRPLRPQVLAPLQGRLPASARLFELVNFQELFPHLAAAIHHGGAGTTHRLSPMLSLRSSCPTPATRCAKRLGSRAAALACNSLPHKLPFNGWPMFWRHFCRTERQCAPIPGRYKRSLTSLAERRPRRSPWSS
ncbi:MAG: hypothetical protein HC802_08920 [Caldilineaceae bacterium]|nr:hypothetical protein [Caldilineaceae bacterium]